jgi:uncharacterized protein YkwD
MTTGRIIFYSVIIGVLLCIGAFQYSEPVVFEHGVVAILGMSASSTAATNGGDATTTSSASSTPNDQVIIESGAVTAGQVITLTNVERAENGGLPGLTENVDLDAAAETKLKDMFAEQYFQHISPNGTGPGILAEEAGYNYVVEGENLALGDFKDTQALLDAWMASPGHRANILNTRYTNIGAAVGQGMFDGKETWLAVQEFGLPLSSCPAIDADLHTAILNNETQASSLSKTLNTLKSLLGNTSTSTPGGLNTYDQDVAHYNAEVDLYNGVTSRLKAEIQTYNAQVQAFNTCIDA